MDRGQEARLLNELRRNTRQIEEAMTLALRLEARSEEIKRLINS